MNIRHAWRGAFLAIALAAALAIAADDGDEDARPLEFDVLKVPLPRGIVAELEDIQKARLELRAAMRDADRSGRDSDLRKAERLEEPLAKLVGELRQTIEEELRGAARDVEKLERRKERLQAAGEREKDARNQRAIAEELAQVEKSLRLPVAVIDAWTNIHSAVSASWRGKPAHNPRELLACVGSRLPTFAFTGPDSQEATSAALTAKGPIVLVLWSKLNPDGPVVLQDVAANGADLKAAGFRLVALNLPTDGDVNRGELLGRTPIESALGRIAPDELYEKLGVRTLPMVLLVQKDGEVHSVFIGRSTNLRGLLRDALRDIAAARPPAR